MISRTRFVPFLLLAMAASMGYLFSQAQKKTALPFPTGYRSWPHVKSMVIFSNQHPLFTKFGGLHNIYVNNVGLSSLQQGRVYPDGTIFVYDLHDIRTAQGAIETRGRKFIGVMKKNAKLYPETGGWGFELFLGDSQKGSLTNMKQCFDCHVSQKSTGYVYSTYTP